MSASDVPFGEDDTDDPIDEINRDRKDVRVQVKEANDALRAAYDARRGSYTRFMQGKPTADDIKNVKDDMRQFCRGEQTTYHENPRTHALLTGRQEVYQRIKDFSTLTLDEIMERYTTPYEANK